MSTRPKPTKEPAKFKSYELATSDLTQVGCAEMVIDIRTCRLMLQRARKVKSLTVETSPEGGPRDNSAILAEPGRVEQLPNG